MRLLIATVFAYFLTACASVPGGQTLGLAPDPDRTAKAAIVTASFVVDGIAVYGKLPECRKDGPKPCRVAKNYTDAKLIAQSLVGDMRLLVAGKRSAIATVATLALIQYQISKTIAAVPGPTDPFDPPRPDAIAYIDAIGAADVLVSTASDRVQDSLSVNSTLADLLADLEVRAAALP